MADARVSGDSIWFLARTAAPDAPPCHMTRMTGNHQARHPDRGPMGARSGAAPTASSFRMRLFSKPVPGLEAGLVRHADAAAAGTVGCHLRCRAWLPTPMDSRVRGNDGGGWSSRVSKRTHETVERSRAPLETALPRQSRGACPRLASNGRAARRGRTRAARPTAARNSPWTLPPSPSLPRKRESIAGCVRAPALLARAQDWTRVGRRETFSEDLFLLQRQWKHAN